MAVALRDLERGRIHRRPALRVVAPLPTPPRMPRQVFWFRRTIVLLVAVTLVIGTVTVVRAIAPDASVATDQIDMTVVVSDGGTLWDLAQRYAPADTDRSAWVAEVADRNDLDPGAIRPGAAVSVPVDVERVTASPQAR